MLEPAASRSVKTAGMRALPRVLALGLLACQTPVGSGSFASTEPGLGSAPDTVPSDAGSDLVVSLEGARARAFVDIDARLHSVLADLRALPNPADRRRLRYIDLSALWNAGAASEQLELHREAVSFILNSLSRGHTVVEPEPLDAERLLYRIDLGDYGWDAASWSLLERDYRYALVYHQDSRLLPHDEASAQQIRRETGADVPVVQADWFVSHASRPPLYPALLRLPATLAQLESELGLSIEANLAAEQALRAGFNRADKGRSNAVVERHELAEGRGALWIGYDFENNLGQRNVFVHPLDFRPDLRQLIFPLDNGLSAYFMVDGTGKRIDKAPAQVAADPLSHDGSIETGISCLSCHQAEGLIARHDEIRDFHLAAGANAQEIEAVLGLYADEGTLADAFERDQQSYRDARDGLSLRTLGNESFHALDDAHQGVMDLAAAAAVLGIRAGELERALGASPRAFPPEILALRVPGGGVQRDAFDAVVGAVAQALGLGTPLIGAVDRDASTPAPLAFDAGSAPVSPADASNSDASHADSGLRTGSDAGTGGADAGAPSHDAASPPIQPARDGGARSSRD